MPLSIFILHLSQIGSFFQYFPLNLQSLNCDYRRRKPEQLSDLRVQKRWMAHQSKSTFCMNHQSTQFLHLAFLASHIGCHQLHTQIQRRSAEGHDLDRKPLPR